MEVAVLGTGAMGRGIAGASTTAGHEVMRGRDGLKRRTAVADDHDQGPESGEADAGMADLDDYAGADLVIEAGSAGPSAERIAVTEAATDGAVIAVTASSPPLADVVSALERPERAVELRSSTPFDLLKAVKVVVTERTDDSAIELATGFVESLGKVPVVTRDTPGFATSRLSVAVGIEAMRMVERGVASPRAIDRTMELGCGHPMGPLELTDVVGLDVRLEALDALREELGERFRPPRILKRMVRAGKLGKEAGEGFYVWEGGEPAVAADG